MASMHFKTVYTYVRVSSLRRGHANLLCIAPILTDDGILLPDERVEYGNCASPSRRSHADAAGRVDIIFIICYLYLLLLLFICLLLVVVVVVVVVVVFFFLLLFICSLLFLRPR